MIDEKKEQEKAITETPNEQKKEPQTGDYLTLSQENEKLTAEVKELKLQIEAIKDQQKKLMLATKVNTLKDQEIRNEEFKKYAKQRLIEDIILPVLLNFERALKYETDNRDVKNFLVGFNYIFNELKTSLAKEGLKSVHIQVGEIFNSHKCEAVATQEITKETKTEKDNMIVAEVAAGYQLHHRIISPVKVKIMKLKQENLQENK